jgi:general secretion pathway protein G
MERRRNRRRNQRGLTLVELVVAFTIMLILSSMARSRVRAARQRELANDLREMRSAIDKYKDYADLGYLGPQKQGTNNWPESLDILVEGVKLPGPDGKKMRFLRRIPIDPFTGKAEWGMRSDQDDPKSLSWGGQDVFDVYTKTTEKAGDGKPYSEW